MKNRLVNIFLRTFRAIHGYYNILAKYDIPLSAYYTKDDTIVLKAIDFSFEKKNLDSNTIVLENYFRLEILKNQFSDFKITKHDNYFILNLDTLSFNIYATEEIFIICEIFIYKHYNIINSRESILIDIGFNIGATSLFFAQMGNIKKIYAYELFEMTYLAGMKNLALNPNVSSKIQVYNFGLSNKDYSDTLPYTFHTKGRMGINGLKYMDNTADSTNEFVQFKNISNEFLKINEESPNCFKICKMDCEGSEYLLIESLNEANLLRLVDYYIIEWHYTPPQNMIGLFINNGFTVHQNTSADLVSGIIICSRT